MPLARRPPTCHPFRVLFCRSSRYTRFARCKDVRLSYFTPAQFETIVGPIRETFSQLVKGRPSLLKKPESQRHVHQKPREIIPLQHFETGVDELHA